MLDKEILKNEFLEFLNEYKEENEKISIDDINDFINSKANTKGIYVNIAGNTELSLDDLLENHFSDTIKISLVIKYQDYSRIELPEDTKNEIAKLKK